MGTEKLNVVTAKAIEHANVHGKKLYYLKLEGGEKSHLINVGESTFKTVNEMIAGDRKEETPKK